MPRYSTTLMDHFNAPRNAGAIESPDAVGYSNTKGQSPRMEIYLTVDDAQVRRATFTTFGCGVTIACGSALTELVANRPIDACHSLSTNDIITALDGIPPDKQFCAELALNALRDGLDKLGATRGT